MSKERPGSVDVRLDQIEIEGYRSCHSTSFRPNRELSALIGINGAGKTNILQAIRLLDARRARSRRRPSDEIPRGIDATITAWFRVHEKRIGLRVRYSVLEGARRGDELVAVDEAWNVQSLTGSRAWKPMPPIALLKGGARGVEISGQFYLFESEADLKRFHHRELTRVDPAWAGNDEVVDAIVAIEEFRSGIAYYSASQFTDPTRCPSSFEVDEDGRLTESYLTAGSVHLKFLHDLYRLRQANADLYEEYCRFVSRQQLGLISRLTWKEVELSSNTAEVKSGGGVKKVRKTKTLVVPKVQIGTAYITFNQLSEGTFKTLALAFYIITDASRFLMVEEPEVCVHHGLLSRLVGTLKAYSRTKQTIISTHSDLLVDDLSPENIFVVEIGRSGTRVKSLEEWLDPNGKDALHNYLAEAGSLGEYWRSGGLFS